MQSVQVSGLVSVIIPCYNKGSLIYQTIDSILSQSYRALELIIINDGSTDNTEETLKKFSDSRIQYIKQQNKGVSFTRNAGLQRSKGQYVVFFDSDDVMPADFIEKRVQYLNDNPEIDFCAGLIYTFKNDIHNHGAAVRPCCNDMISEVVLFKEGRYSVPSNYMYRSSLLVKKGVRFNERLSSTADRFFLFEAGAVGKCGLITDGGELYYRMSPDSMSNKLTLNLIRDQDRFFGEVLKSAVLPHALKEEVKWKRNQLMIGSYYQLRRFISFTGWVMLSIFHFPGKTLSFLFSKVLHVTGGREMA